MVESLGIQTMLRSPEPTRNAPLSPHLDVTVGEEKVHHDVQAEQLHAVQALLDASQLPAQLLPPVHLPCPPDIPPDHLPKIPAGDEGRRRGGFWGGGNSLPSPASLHGHEVGFACRQGGWQQYQESVGILSRSWMSRAASGVKAASVSGLGWKSSVRGFTVLASQQTTLFWGVTV